MQDKNFQIKCKVVTDESSSVEPGKKQVMKAEVNSNRKFTQKLIPN